MKEVKICSVQYWKDDLCGYGGRAYTYFTALSLKNGDEVFAPTVTGDKRAMVIDCDRTELDEGEKAFADRIRTITKYFEKEE